MERLIFYDERFGGNYFINGCGVHIENCPDTQYFGRKIVTGEAIDKFAKYEEAEEDGRLIVLPCKVGDTVFEIGYSEGDNFPMVVPHYIYNLQEIIFWMLQDMLGKQVFITENEAKLTLEIAEKNNEHAKIYAARTRT